MPEFRIPKLSPPLPRTYWVVGNKLLAGAYAGREDPDAHRKRLLGLFGAGIRTVVNLMEDDERNNVGVPFVRYADDLQDIAAQTNESVTCLRFPIVDGSITTNEHMARILDAIDGSLSIQRPVYVHCFGGIGRTGSVVCCWLLRHGYATPSNVFDVLQRLRKADRERASRPAPENETQRRFVSDWADKLAAATAKQPSPPASRRDWFTKLTGFSERTPDEVRDHIEIQGQQLTSKANGKTYAFGRLEIVSLGELRRQVDALSKPDARLKLEELVGDARALHADPTNAGALFQVASQFNLLEMVSPRVTPEQGIGIYESDPTQGPACAIACGAGTIYRNYFVPLADQIGQSASCQVDCLALIGAALGNVDDRLWKMRNGYALPSAEGLDQINATLDSLTESSVDTLRSKLQVGIQWNTQVTLDGCQHLVSQVYCSAMPVAYSGLPARQWQRFARLILEAAYEATFAAAVLNVAKSGNQALYLTLLGGGAFGNDQEWILDAIQRACQLFRNHDLDVKIVSFRSSNAAVQKLMDSVTKERSGAKPQPRTPSQSLPDHCCPVCGTKQRVFLRYPWYICNECLTLAEDGDGRRLEFGNTSFSGGLYCKYVDESEVAYNECGTVLCLIQGRPVMVSEARFGGVVAQPLNSQLVALPEDCHSVDLRRRNSR